MPTSFWGARRDEETRRYSAPSKGLYFFVKTFVKVLSEHANCPASIYLFKVNDRNARIMSEICSKLTIKISDGRHVVVMFLLLTLGRFHIFLVFLLLAFNK